MLLSILAISRTSERISELLAALKRSGTPPETEVLISWNGTSEEKLAVCQPEKLAVNILERHPYNFAENSNYLATKARGEYLLFINDDIIPDSSSIHNAIDAIRREYVGIVGANLRYPDGRLQHAGVFFDERAKPYHRHKHEVIWTDEKVRNDMFVPAVTGAFMLVRRSDFNAIRFDQSFEVAGEDIVFCLKYRSKFAREILYAANVTAVHIENATRRLTETRLTPETDLSRITAAAREIRNGQYACEVKRPKIRIVTESHGWIMHRKAAEIQKYLKNVRINEEWPEADIHYYINYGKFCRRPRNGIIVANFTHYDRHVLADKFVSVAHEVDHCVAVSRKTADDLQRLGISDEKITTIIVGADSSFQPKLTLGVVGRVYKGGRKGEDVVRALVQDHDLMRHVRIVATNDDWGLPVWKLEEPGDFYRAIDYLLVPSRLEGGPVPFMEALACGTLSIAPPIGVVPEFPHIGYPAGDVDQLKAVITRLVRDQISRHQHLSNHMLGLDWSGWAIQHEKLFRHLLVDSKIAVSREVA